MDNRTLAVARHAKAASPEDVDDIERPLSSRGERDSGALGQWLAEHLTELDFVVCSPAVRARQTWDIARRELAREPRVFHDRRVYGATAGELIEVVRSLPNEAHAVLLVGHNPDLSDLVEVLTARTTNLATSGVAVLSAPAEWASVEPGVSQLTAAGSPRAR